jgi:hypothetical protein
VSRCSQRQRARDTAAETYEEGRLVETQRAASVNGQATFQQYSPINRGLDAPKSRNGREDRWLLALSSQIDDDDDDSVDEDKKMRRLRR